MLLLGEKDFATGGHARFDANSLVMVTLRQSTSCRNLFTFVCVSVEHHFHSGPARIEFQS
jgi:hypothetical protein